MVHCFASLLVRVQMCRRWFVRAGQSVVRVGRPALLGVPVMATLAVSACSSDPWVDSRREAGSLQTVGDSHPDRPVVCYAGDLADQASKIQTLADNVCAISGRHARYIGSTRWQCRLVTPHKAYFVCE